MIILGIDPGSRVAGYALIEAKSKSLKYLCSGVLKFDHEELFLDRLNFIYLCAKELVEKLKPDQIALESLIYVKSPTALIKLAQSRGAMLAAFSQTHKGRIFEYSPNLIKSCTVGHGHANKQNIQKFLDLMVGKVEYATHDESDALAVAICHSVQGHHEQNGRQKKSRSQRGDSLKSRKNGLVHSLQHAVKKQLGKDQVNDSVS